MHAINYNEMIREHEAFTLRDKVILNDFKVKVKQCYELTWNRAHKKTKK